MMKLLFAVLDANVLYPQVLRDVLLSLSFNGVYAARWSDKIHDEWTRNLQKQRPDLSPAQLERTRRLMNEQIEDSLVEDYQYLIPTLELPDPDDCHVLAAAIHSQSEIIVTWNLKDFPRRVLEEHAITALSPDQFLSERFAEKRALVIAALAEQRQRMKNPPQTPAQFIESLQRQKLTRFVAALRDYEGGLQKNSSAPNFFGALLFYRINSLMSRNRTRPQQLLNFLQTRVARLVVGRFQIQA